MTARTARVSVGVPVYNGERFLEETLAALVAQEFADLEIIVSDNGSTDGTQAICERFAAADERIRYLRSPVNRGTGWNFNYVLGQATAPLFMWNAADDVIAPSYIGRCVAALDADPEAVLAYSRVQLIDADSQVFDALNDRDLGVAASTATERVRRFLLAQAVHIEYGVMPRELVLAVGGEPPIHGGDVVFGIRMLMRGKAVLVPEQLFRSRRHEGQGSVLRTMAAQVREHRPSTRLTLAFPQTRIVTTAARSILQGPLPVAERLACLRVLLTCWVIPRRRSYASDVRRNLQMLAEFVSSRVRTRG